MITVAQVLAGLVVIGVLGSAIEKIGDSLNLPRVTAAGKILEAVASDAPKVIANIVGIFKGAK